MKASKKPKAIWEAKVPVEKENNVPEVNISAVMEEVPEVHISVAEEVAYKGDREAVVSSDVYSKNTHNKAASSSSCFAQVCPKADGRDCPLSSYTASSTPSSQS